MNRIKLPPFAPVLMESTRAMGYSLEAAIADLLDNSISAKATNIKIYFFPLDNPYLSIIDNGTGMSADELTNAMRYGSCNPLDIRNKNDLGRFGLGMKTASLSQCRCLTVVSYRNGVFEARRWDLDEINRSSEWDLLVLDDEQIIALPNIDVLKAFSHGTMVIWQKLDRIFAGDFFPQDSFAPRMDKARDHIALVFHRYLFGEGKIKRVTISINNSQIEPIDPFLLKKSDQVMDTEIIVAEKEKITVTPYILPHMSKMTVEELEKLGGDEGLRKKQGFYVYRNNRLLVWGTWFRMMRQAELYKLARVKVDIPNSLDHLWNLDIRKSTATPPEIVRKNLSRIIVRIAEGSKRKSTVRKIKEIDKETCHVWTRQLTRDGIRYVINREHPMVNAVKKTLANTSHNVMEQLLSLIESTIPLNALYVDLIEDQKFAEDSESISSILAQIASILKQTDNQSDNLALLESLRVTEPYSLYPELLDKLRKEVQIDG